MANEKTSKMTLTQMTEYLNKCKATQVEKMKTGDIPAGRIANAIQNDLNNVNRVLERIDKGYYEGK